MSEGCFIFGCCSTQLVYRVHRSDRKLSNFQTYIDRTDFKWNSYVHLISLWLFISLFEENVHCFYWYTIVIPFNRLIIFQFSNYLFINYNLNIIYIIIIYKLIIYLFSNYLFAPWTFVHYVTSAEASKRTHSLINIHSLINPSVIYFIYYCLRLKYHILSPTSVMWQYFITSLEITN